MFEEATEDDVRLNFRFFNCRYHSAGAVYMRYALLIHLALCCSFCSFGQTKALEIPISQNSNGSRADTSFWYKEYSKLIPQLNLADLQTSKDSFHFRFWANGQAIDIITDDGRIVTGTLTNFGQRYDRKLSKKMKQKIFKLTPDVQILDSITATYIYQLVASWQIDKIPADNKIKGWGEGLDGIEYIIETSTRKNYAFRTYWTPFAFAQEIPEAKKIQVLINYLFNDLKMGERYDELKTGDRYLQAGGVPGINIRIQNITPGTGKVIDLL